jgi:hypothetical protein
VGGDFGGGWSDFVGFDSHGKTKKAGEEWGEAMNGKKIGLRETREALSWAYQAIGALWPNKEALDNLSAVIDGKPFPHEWPVVPAPQLTSGQIPLEKIIRQKESGSRK